MESKEMVSLIDALRDGVSLDEIRESFETALQEAQDEIAAEKAAEAAEFEDEETFYDLDLDEAREELAWAIVNYIEALDILPEGMEITDENVEDLIEVIESVEEEYKAQLSFIKMLPDIITRAAKETATAKANKAPSVAEKREGKGCIIQADDIIAEFLKSLS